MKGRIRIAIACTGLQLVAAASAHAQTMSREAGSITVGGYLVWVRGTNANVVQLFMGRGFRDAFAKAHDMNAARLQQWIDSVRAVTPVPADDSSSADAQLRGSALGADVTMMRRVGGSFSGLRVLVNGEDPIRMAEPTARDFIGMLDSAARVTRELSAPPPAVAANIASVPVASVPTVPSVANVPSVPIVPVASVQVASVPVASAPPADAPTVARVPAPTEVSTMGPSTSEAAPELVLPAPSQPVMPVGTAPEPSPLQTPAIVPHVDVPSDKLIRTPLGPFTIPGALLSDRDKEAQYCYKQLGLKYNPDLKGEITVRLSLGNDGAVQEAVVTKRSWQGISAGEVESCVRALAHDWTFASSDPSVASGAKLLTFSFAP